MTYIYYFKSYSGDEYFMKSLTQDYTKFEGERFCKEKIPDEYSGWDCGFKYECFNIYSTEDDSFIKIPRRCCGEYYKVFPNDIPEFDVAFFSDVYCPETFEFF